MAITDKTRKVLWARSGNRCAICRAELIMDECHPADDKSVIGDECHIVAREPGGPRGTSPLSADERDLYSNLLLLCKSDHKLIDDQPNNFTVDRLIAIKMAHEYWVRSSLSQQSTGACSPNEPFIATRIRNAGEALRLASSADGGHYDNDSPNDEIEADAIGSFLQDLQEYTDLSGDLSNREKIQCQLRTKEQLALLEDLGFVVYGSSRAEKWLFGKAMKECTICYVLVLRSHNPLVRRKEDDLEKLFPENDSTDDLSNFVICVRKSGH